MSSHTRLSKFDGELLDDPTTYRKLVRGLQYDVITHPEIAFTIEKLCQF